MYKEKTKLMGNDLEDVGTLLMMRLEALSKEGLNKIEISNELKKCNATAKITKELINLSIVRMRAAELFSKGVIITNMNGGMQVLGKGEVPSSQPKLLE